MPFVSTGPGTETASLEEALFRGLALDGGLYVPSELPFFPPKELAEFQGAPWQDIAWTVANGILSEFLDPNLLREVVRKALDFPIPLRPVTERIQVLELFHGPTLAFKDVGARFMAHLMAHFRREDSGPLTILTATSGDTGGAVAQAFLGLPGIRVVVLFPDGKVTPRQEHQFSTLGQNVHALAVQGDFDDCQRMVKAAFQDQDLRRRRPVTSANSINVGRLIPQSFYYFLAWAEAHGSRENATDSLLFSVPSGNFGNLAAGLMARAMGLPRVRFLAATNANDEVPRYLATGTFLPRPSIRTLSTAMDVGNPSNLARILHQYRGDMSVLRRDLAAISVTDEETTETIRRVHREHGYVLDPHSAVGFRALEESLDDGEGARGILLATAHPAKFAEVVEPILGEPLPLPRELADCLARERRVTEVPPEAGALREFLLEN